MPFKTTPRGMFGGSGAVRRKLNRFQSQFAPRGPDTPSSREQRFAANDIPPKGTVVVKAGPEGTLLLKAHLPGLQANDIDLDITDDVLTLRGDRRKATETPHGRRDRRKQHLGFFQRAFRLPAGVAGDKVNADFEDGTLTITIPRSPTRRHEEIEIRKA